MRAVDREMGKSACCKIGYFCRAGRVVRWGPACSIFYFHLARAREKKGRMGVEGSEQIIEGGRVALCVTVTVGMDQGGTLRLLDPPGFLTALLALVVGTPLCVSHRRLEYYSHVAEYCLFILPFTHTPPHASRGLPWPTYFTDACVIDLKAHQRPLISSATYYMYCTDSSCCRHAPCQPNKR